ncbi:MAG: MerR family transcriptional regulator [Actinomycetota bacterium]|nr:MerR family transcriptional regulator [Actinomycetota bacterium]
MASRDYMTIGEVVERLSPAYPDLSISKVRFLEEEGLVSPERTAGGYRKFTQADVARVELILRLQKDHFLPLAVIRDKLADFDKGKLPSEFRPQGGAVAEPVALPFEDAETLRLEDAQSSLGLPSSFIEELADFGLVEILRGENGAEISRTDVHVAHACWDLRRFGVEPRHLRMYETFAEREAVLFSQILMPTFRHRTPETRQKLVETLGELQGLTGDLKSHLLRRALGRKFDDLS